MDLDPGHFSDQGVRVIVSLKIKVVYYSARSCTKDRVTTLSTRPFIHDVAVLILDLAVLLHDLALSSCQWSDPVGARQPAARPRVVYARI